MSNTYLHQVENGRRNPPITEKLHAMADAYGVSRSDMMSAAKRGDVPREAPSLSYDRVLQTVLDVVDRARCADAVEAENALLRDRVREAAKVICGHCRRQGAPDGVEEGEWYHAVYIPEIDTGLGCAPCAASAIWIALGGTE